MSREFGRVIDLSQLEPPEGEREQHVRERYEQMIYAPHEFGASDWVSHVVATVPDGVESALALNVMNERQSEPSELFRSFSSRVAVSATGIFGSNRSKDKGIFERMIQTTEGFGRFRLAVLNSCTWCHPGVHGELAPFNDQYFSQWNAWYPLFVEGVIPSATSEELERLQIQQRIHMPQPCDGRLIFPVGTEL